MPRGIKAGAARLPSLEGVKFKMVMGKEFVSVQSAATLAGLHPVVLEMGRELLKSPGGQGAAFELGTPEMVKAAEAIAASFKVGLKRVAKAFEPNKKLKTNVLREDKRIVCWYSA